MAFQRCRSSERVGVSPVFLAVAGFWLLAAVAAGAGAFPLDISPAESQRIGARIFQNECAGKPACLVSWNRHEAFISLGIGHFIWYPAGAAKGYRESFPLLVRYLADHGVAPPAVAVGPDGGIAACPWRDRRAFEADRHGSAARALRRYLKTTLDGQVNFMLHRLEVARTDIFKAAPAGDRSRVERQFALLAGTPMGRYALVDYVNFKGEGLLPEERIEGQGWGLLQVLLEMDPPEGRNDPLRAFSAAADRVLTRRAAADPRPHVKKEWLSGWRRRLATYLEPQL